MPLPQTGQATESDKAQLHSIETAIIDWTHQIKNVIRSDSSSLLKDGSNPGPMAEIDFWNAKYANLKSIYEQLTDPKIQKVSQILQAVKSSYFPAFQSVFKEVQLGKYYYYYIIVIITNYSSLQVWMNQRMWSSI